MNGKYNEGHVIVTSLIILLVLVIVITSLSLLISDEISFLAREKGDIKAFYTAEAGIEYGSSIIYDDSKWNSDLEQFELKQNELDKINNAISGGTVSNIIKEIDEENPNLITIISTARSGGVEKRIINKYLLSSQAFNYSLVSNGAITMGNSVNIYAENGGDVYAKGDIFIENEETYESNVTLYKNQEINIIPTIDFAALKNNEFATIYSPPEGENSINLSSLEEDIGDKFTYIEGDFTIDSNESINGSGVLVIEGKLNIENNFDINSSSDDFFLIFVKGEVEEYNPSIESKNKLDIRGLIYCNGNIVFKNSPTITGTIISTGDMNFKNALDIIFNDSYLNTFSDWNMEIPIGSSGTNKVLQLMSWQEN